jgi:hypothetical protein
VGVAVLFQAAAGVGNWGNLSNPMDVRIRL